MKKKLKKLIDKFYTPKPHDLEEIPSCWCKPIVTVKDRIFTVKHRSFEEELDNLNSSKK